jgi:hypothetical protein
MGNAAAAIHGLMEDTATAGGIKYQTNDRECV